MTFAAETNATRLQSRGRGMADSDAPAVAADRRTDTHTDTLLKQCGEGNNSNNQSSIFLLDQCSREVADSHAPAVAADRTDRQTHT